MTNPYTNPPSGTPVIDGWQLIAPSSSRTARATAVYKWDTPWSADASGQRQIYWEKQPGAANDALKVVWMGDGKTWMANSDLSVDRVVAVRPGGVAVNVRHAGQVELPKLSL